MGVRIFAILPPMEEAVARNIVVLPPEEMAKECRAWSGLIADQIGSHIDLRREDMLPHVSLYNTAFPIGTDAVIVETLQSLTKTLAPFDIHLKGTSIVHGNIFANAERTADIDRIHETLIEALNSVREGMFNPGELALQLSSEELDRLKKTGMLLSLDAFLPHVTLARPTDSNRTAEAVSLLPQIDTSAKVDAIHLVETGPYGTCKRLIESFTFGA